jgi:hypothetical protein
MGRRCTFSYGLFELAISFLRRLLAFRLALADLACSRLMKTSAQPTCPVELRGGSMSVVSVPVASGGGVPLASLSAHRPVPPATHSLPHRLTRLSCDSFRSKHKACPTGTNSILFLPARNAYGENSHLPVSVHLQSEPFATMTYYPRLQTEYLPHPSTCDQAIWRSRIVLLHIRRFMRRVLSLLFPLSLESPL